MEVRVAAVTCALSNIWQKLFQEYQVAFDQAEYRVLLDGPLECQPIRTRKRSCAARVRVTCGFAAAHEWLLWVLKIPSLEKDASSVNNTDAAKKGFANRCCKYLCEKA
ncbi:hypothetical protein TNCV_4744501 [Trichonephila clavipes]|nr:hypothetical protein TNCV_4744501 [Trichonephila clavipes]